MAKSASKAVSEKDFTKDSNTNITLLRKDPPPVARYPKLVLAFPGYPTWAEESSGSYDQIPDLEPAEVAAARRAMVGTYFSFGYPCHWAGIFPALTAYAPGETAFLRDDLERHLDGVLGVRVRFVERVWAALCHYGSGPEILEVHNRSQDYLSFLKTRNPLAKAPKPPAGLVDPETKIPMWEKPPGIYSDGYALHYLGWVYRAYLDFPDKRGTEIYQNLFFATPQMVKDMYLYHDRPEIAERISTEMEYLHVCGALCAVPKSFNGVGDYERGNFGTPFNKPRTPQQYLLGTVAGRMQFDGVLPANIRVSIGTQKLTEQARKDLAERLRAVQGGKRG